MGQTNHKVLPYVTGIIQDYGNCDTDYIQNELSPKVKVARREFAYREFDKVKPFDVVTDADMQVGDYAQVVEIETNTSNLATDSTIDRGIENPISWHDFSESGQECSGLDTNIMVRHADYLRHKYMLTRELRVKQATQTVGNYPAENQHQVPAGSQIYDPNAANYIPFLDLIGNIMGDAQVTPNVLVLPKKTWWVARRQPSVNGSTFAARNATTDELAAALGIQKVLIAQPYFNNAGTLSQVWENDKIILAHIAEGFDDTLCPKATFSFSASLDGDMQVWATPDTDKSIGLRGGVRVRVGEGLKEKFFFNMGHIVYDFLVEAP